MRADSTGRESWYGRWTVDGVRMKRCLGPKRIPSTRDGLTRAQAERELRRMMAEVWSGTPFEAVKRVPLHCELVPLFDIAQPTLSHHLSKLRAAGIVDSERRGLWAYYYVIPGALQELSAWLS